MNDPLYKKLQESGWRRPLTAAEAAELRGWLAAHPEMELDWDAEAGLNRALDHLPDAPVPTNFTTRVLQEIEREAVAARDRKPAWGWRWRSLVPKVAVVLLVLGLGVVSYERHQATRRATLARNVAVVSGAVAVPDPGLLQDFDAIRSLDPDEDLLALMQ